MSSPQWTLNSWKAEFSQINCAEQRGFGVDFDGVLVYCVNCPLCGHLIQLPDFADRRCGVIRHIDIRAHFGELFDRIIHADIADYLNHDSYISKNVVHGTGCFAPLYISYEGDVPVATLQIDPENGEIFFY